MTNGWEPRGRIDFASIARIAVSPEFANDGVIAAISPAGLHISLDAGDTWFAPGRGAVGPFIRDVAIGPNGAMIATSPVGLFRSSDSGLSWDASDPRHQLGAVAFANRDCFFACSEKDGAIWHGVLGSPLFRRTGSLREPAAQLIVSERELLAVSGGLFRSIDSGSSWTAASVPDDIDFQAISPLGGGGIAAISEYGMLWLGKPGQPFATPLAMRDQCVTSIATSADGAIIAAGSVDCVCMSIDHGASWTSRQFDGAVLSLALSPDGSRLVAGLAGGGVRISDDMGTSWRVVPAGGGAVIVDHDVEHGMVRSTLVEDVTLEARCAEQLVDWCEVDRSPDLDAPSPAVPGDGYLIVSDAGARNRIEAPPFAPGEDVVELKFGCSGDDDQFSIAAATRNAEAACGVWLRTGEAPWRKVIAHPETAGTISLVMIGGARGLFAGIGDSIYRPARVGTALFSREIIDPDRDLSVLKLKSAADAAGRIVLAALTTSGIYFSRDRALTWSHLPEPIGAPITAIALQSKDSSIEVLAAQLGGELRSWQVP